MGPWVAHPDQKIRRLVKTSYFDYTIRIFTTVDALVFPSQWSNSRDGEAQNTLSIEFQLSDHFGNNSETEGKE